MSHHYGGNGCGYANVSVQIIDQVDEGDNIGLAEKEVYSKTNFRCYVQNGGKLTAIGRKNNPWTAPPPPSL